MGKTKTIAASHADEPESVPAAQPFVKWVGGKRGILPALLDRLPPQFDRYYEPFVGGGALFFALQQRRAPVPVELSDVNADLIATYRAVQQHPEALIAALEVHAARHDADYYYQVRQRHGLADPVDRAARLLYLNRTCYNGLYRVNRRGEFNVPIGRYKNPNIVRAENIRACHRVLQDVAIVQRPFDRLVPTGDRCLIYFDPPYHPSDDGSFTGYSKLGFTADDQAALRDFARKLHAAGHYVLLSNSNAELIRDLYADPIFRVEVIRAPRLVNCKSSQRQAVGEVLVSTF